MMVKAVHCNKAYPSSNRLYSRPWMSSFWNSGLKGTADYEIANFEQSLSNVGHQVIGGTAQYECADLDYPRHRGFSPLLWDEDTVRAFAGSKFWSGYLNSKPAPARAAIKLIVDEIVRVKEANDA